MDDIEEDFSGLFRNSHADGNGGGSGADQQELIVRREGVRREPEHGFSAFRREAVFKFRDSSWIQEQGTPGRRTSAFRMDGDFAPKRGWTIVFNGNPPMAGADGLHRGYSRKTHIFQRFPYTPCGLPGGTLRAVDVIRRVMPVGPATAVAVRRAGARSCVPSRGCQISRACRAWRADGPR